MKVGKDLCKVSISNPNGDKIYLSNKKKSGFNSIIKELVEGSCSMNFEDDYS